jgi:hypothetical protein
MDSIGAALMKIDAALAEVSRAVNGASTDNSDVVAALVVVAQHQAEAIHLLAQRIERLCT